MINNQGSMKNNFQNANNVNNNQKGVLTVEGKVIRPEKVRLISESGENIGVLILEEAIKISNEQNLDLVLVSDKDIPIPVVKIMNFSKRLYEEKKKKNLAKKKHHEIQTKELRVSAKIGDHDLFNKCKQAVSFLKEGDRVKFVMIMRGRERSLKDTFGVAVFAKIINYLKDNSEGNGKTLFMEGEAENSWSVLKTFILKSTNK